MDSTKRALYSISRIQPYATGSETQLAPLFVFWPVVPLPPPPAFAAAPALLRPDKISPKSAQDPMHDLNDYKAEY